jgi:Double zinc ribbon
MTARRFSLFARRPPPPPEFAVDGGGETPPEHPPPLTAAAALRERRSLVRRREIEMRDVGGLTVEMVRRDRFKPDLLVSRASEVLALERRIHELDAFLAASEAVPRTMQTATLCKCGAPLARGAHFCAHCGRPAVETAPLVACIHCGNPLPAEANFCSACGNSVAADEFGETEGRVDETLVVPGAKEPNGE